MTTLVATGLMPAAERPRPARGRLDPRLFQIMSLLGLLVYGLCGLSFDISLGSAALVVSSALLTQYLLSRFEGLVFEHRSALISALSLCLLLRTNSSALFLVAPVIAISSKFLIRVGAKHVFNPTNIAIVLLLAGSGRIWVSPGQWGSLAFFAFLSACLGSLVVNRAYRSDVTYAFLLFHLVIVFGRSAWLGEPTAIPLHRVQNGSLLLFAFFMISDPKTTPDSRWGRVLFAALVALGAGYVQFVLFRTNGLFYSLAAVSALTPLIDRALPGPRYQWGQSPQRRV
jgi:Na+-transporting NADH:ubiquinone oxidoreductase subunit NqrB